MFCLGGRSVILNLSTFDVLKSADDESAIRIEGELLEKCQKIVLEIADDVAAACRENNINYTLGGGSALGAVRHQGMIPWDDDIDLNIFRGDYDRFLEAFRRMFGEKYWIHTPEETKNYGLLFIQIVKKGTVLRGREEIGAAECGISIDVFPYENTYDNKALRIMHGVLCMGMKFALSCRKTWAHRNLDLRLVKDNPKGKRIIMVKCAIGAILSPFSIDAWTHGTIRCCKMYKNNHSRYVAIPSGRKQFFGEIYNREETADTRLVPFQGREYLLTRSADSYLRKLYGDYMQIPPPERREHHIAFELDFGDNK